MKGVIWQEIIANGISRVPAPLPKHLWNSLYADFDAFTSSLLKHPERVQSFNEEAKYWQENSGLRLLYGGYFSPYFRDTTKQEGKDQKRIIQFCEPYYRDLYERRSPLLDNMPFRRLIDGMMAALYSSFSSLQQELGELRVIEPRLYTALNPENTFPPISIRLLSYDVDRHLATNPHVDKSAITVILDVDDPETDSKLIFGDIYNLTIAAKLSSFKPVFKEANESLIFMGAAPNQGGFSKFRPMPHAVGPFEGRVRHSAIFFWHLPNVDMRDFDTKVLVEDDTNLLRAMSPKNRFIKIPVSPSKSLIETTAFTTQQATAYNQLALVYQAQHEQCQQIRRDVLERVLVGLGDNITALDVGCGIGAYLSLMAERGIKAQGIDLSENMVRTAQAQSRRPVRCADFRTAIFDQQFDLVFAQAFVHLFPKNEVAQVIEKLKSLAGKRLYFSTSVALQPSEGWEEKDGAIRYRSRYTSSEFANLIASSVGDGCWRAHSFELVDPDNKHWVQAILDRN